MDNLTRNIADRQTVELEQMLAKENDEGKRASLIVLSSINSSAIATAELAHSLYTELELHKIAFQNHVQAGERVFYFGKGVWFVMTGVLALAQVFFGWSIYHIGSQFEQLHAVDVSVALDMAAMRGEIQSFKGSKGDDGAQGIRGKTGATGDTGDAGPKGAPGKNFWNK